jgi:ABC-type antimicrobial peptide transport system permease subunit
MAYMVAQRRREFGIRLAIGATPGRIALLVLREAGAIGIAGLLLGIPCAYAGSKWGQQALYGLKAMQGEIWASAALGILLVIMLTAWIPAHVAAMLNPQIALKEE